jgi:murein DD-endopeptidase MepM/ murein hydrolase activator NlpD
VPAFLRALLAASVVVLTATTSLVSSTGSALADTPAKPTQSAHPFSDPTWFPLRTPATIGCAKSGCGTSSDHGFDAIDLLGNRGDPVYAAGAGVAHIGGNSGGCSGSDAVEAGRWVWIDHGGGVTSRYRHLDSIAVRDGQLVTPATRIGAMGHSGDVPPCSTNYLHFEVRHGGLDGDRVDFGPLRGCQ